MVDLIKLKELFDIEYGNQLDRNKMDSDENGINFVSRSSKELGIAGRVKRLIDIPPFSKELITVTLGGTYLLSSFVQPEDFYTAQNIKVLRPKIEMCFRTKLFYCYVISKNRFRYSSHGREANKTLDYLLVPKIDSIPDWVHSVKFSKISNQSVSADALPICNPRTWKEFSFDDLFEIQGSKTTAFPGISEFSSITKYPYVGTQATNNGVRGFSVVWTEQVGDNGIFTIDSAVLGYCAYQEKPFAASGSERGLGDSD